MKADGKNEYLAFGNNADVVKFVLRSYEKWRNQPEAIVEDIRNCDTEEACFCIFWYLINNVRYKEDRAGYQYIKSPARLLKDGVGDCKSMTIFIASCLHCLGIPHTIRFVNFDGGNQYTHVYCIAYNENGQKIILDAVERDSNNEPVYDYAREYKKKIEYNYK